ncbi:elongation factor P [Qipengyuania nanhaisediminis]|uniref:elongation factor P n=1 Tax=Qipengyuania nanhaisediminis TaxID=604088 RepID=UPI0038B3355D
MKTIHVILLTAFAAALAAGAPAFGSSENAADAPTALPSDGPLRTMPHGVYECALPGNAGGAAHRVVGPEGFRIFTASRYENTAGSGTYILRGRELTFTRGPKKGERFRRIGDNQLRKIDTSGERTDLLCTRIGAR